MVVKSLEYPVYNRRRKGGLSGEVPKIKGISSTSSVKTFEEYLQDAFNGETVQEGLWFSSNLSEMTKRNLRKI